jgi:CheY-like chemotaxis protein
MSDAAPLLIQVVELGGYPNFTSLYERLGYRVETVNTGRKAISMLKKLQPDVVVAEFNYQFDFRDRTSHLESILAVLQPLSAIRVVVFYDKAEQEQLDKVAARFPGFTAMAYPVEEAGIEAALA